MTVSASDEKSTPLLQKWPGWLRVSVILGLAALTWAVIAFAVVSLAG